MRPDNDPPGQDDRTFTERARRAQIVGCAIETIAELGYARASLAEIAKRAAVSKGVISYHFAGKDELIEQVIVEICTRGGEHIGSRVQQEPTAAGALRGYLEANLAFIEANPTDIRVVGEILVNFRDADGSLRYGPSDNEAMLQPLQEILRSGKHAGEFRDFATRPMAIAIRAAIDAASGQMIADADFDVGSYTRELVALFGRATREEP